MIYARRTIVFRSFLVAALFWSEVISVPSPKGQERLVDVKVLTEYSNPDGRVRREADSNLPDHLSFQVPLTKGEVTLRMKRSRLLPTSTSQSGVVTPYSENVAVYTDIDNGASMIVRRNEGEYNLQGSFLHDGTEWHLEPLNRARRSSGKKSHTLLSGLPKVETISFSGDAYKDEEPPVEIHSLAERNRYHFRRLARLQGKRDAEGDGQLQATGSVHNTERKDMSKRDATQHIVEMVFVVDHADYQKWVTYKGSSNAVNEMTIWYTYIADMVLTFVRHPRQIRHKSLLVLELFKGRKINIRYRTIEDSDIAMGTKVTHLKILTTDSEDDFIEDLISSGTFDGGAGLSAFRTWIMAPANAIPNADHYMYFTGFDIQSAAGVAFTSRVCTASGVSITENDFAAGVSAVAAHELGHSLSASHDGNTGSCSDSTSNIMSTIFSIPVTTNNKGNPWRFSSCSISSFKTYLGGVSCTEPQNTGSTDVLPAPTGDDRAGIALDRDNQCRQYFRDSASYYCSGVQNSNGGESNLCGGMFCSIPSDSNSCESMLPVEYTTCGTDKWCRLGICLDESAEPTNPPPGQGGSSPENIFDCIPFLLRLDFLGLLGCFRDVFFG